MDNLILNSQSELIMRAKVLALHRLGKPILSNPTTFRPSEKAQLIKLVKEILENIPEATIIKDFNELAEDKLFQPTDDYTTYPVIQKSEPSPAPIEEWKVRVAEDGTLTHI